MSTVAKPSYRKRTGYQAGLLGVFTMLAAAFLVMGNIATRDAIEQRRAEEHRGDERRQDDRQNDCGPAGHLWPPGSF